MVARERLEDQNDRDVTLAYRIESLHRTKKLPSLLTLLTKRRQMPQSVGEMKQTLHILAARYGGAVRSGGSGKAAHGR